MIWENEHLGFTLAVDTETTVTDFTVTPELVTIQVHNGDKPLFVRVEDVDAFFKVHKDSVLIFHNIVFDLEVLCKHLGDRNYFHNYLERDLLRDTLLEYKLLKLAHNGIVPMKCSLDLVYSELCNGVLDKNEDIRLTFDRYLGKPVEDIAEDHKNYGLQDAVATYDIYQVLMQRIGKLPTSTRLSEQIQIAGSIALNRIYKRGIGFDLDKAQDKLKEINTRLEEYQNILALYGWVRGMKGIKDRYDNIIESMQLNVPRTACGNYSSKGEDLIPFKDNHFIDTYLKYIEWEKMSTFIREVKRDRLHPRYNSIVNTGRTSCAKPNFQQLPRSGGIRELFVAKPGHTFIITDYSTLELCTLAQINYKMYGHSKMKDMINAGQDLHKYFASVLLKKYIDDVTSEERRKAKAVLFGRPGGLGKETFKVYAKVSYGVEFTDKEIKDIWKAYDIAFPEMKLYLSEEIEDAITLTGRIRGNVAYCAGKNTPFQGLAADGAKIAMYYLDHAGFDIVGFVHDEVVSEVPIEEAHDMLKEQERIMIEAMEQVVPDVKISVESIVSKRYCK